MLPYGYQILDDLVEGERVLLFFGDTHDQSCEAELIKGDHGYFLKREGPQFKDVWVARLDETTWKDLSADELRHYEANEHVTVHQAPTRADWDAVLGAKQQYDLHDNCPACQKHRKQ